MDINRNSRCTLVADAHYLPFKPGSFTHVVLFEVLEHLRCPFDALHEIGRVLSQKGSVLLSVPNVMFYRVILRWLLKNKITVCAGHISGWTSAELQNLLTKTGFVVVKSGFNDRPWLNKASVFANVLPRVTKACLVIEAMKF